MSYSARPSWRGRFLQPGSAGLYVSPGWRGAARLAGLGDVLNPTAGTALDCGLFAGGVFKPECWAKTLGPTKLFGKTIVSEADYQAAYALAHPDLAYPPMPLPSPPPAVEAGTSSVPAPYDAESYAAAVDAAIAEGARRTKAAVQSYFTDTAASLQQAAAGGDGSPDGGGTNWWPWVILGGLVLVGFAAGGRRR